MTLEELQAENEKLKTALADAKGGEKDGETRKRLEFLEAEHKQLIEARDKAKEEKRKAEEKRLAEAGEFKTLAEQEKAMREKVEADYAKTVERLTAYEKRAEEKLNTLLEKVPEDKRQLIRPDLDIDYRLQLAESLIVTEQKPPGYRPPGDPPKTQPTSGTGRIAEALRSGALN